MTGENGYNGWKNYETWAIALWLDNEYETYKLMQYKSSKIIKSVLKDANFDYQLSENREKLIQNSAYRLADEIRKYIEQNNPISSEASVYVDLLNAAISEADYIEIAEHYLDDDTIDSVINSWF